jgi:hypothetical protein
MADNIIHIQDPDQPIYRIFPLWYFEEALRVKNIVLVHPSTWEDPFEVLSMFIAVEQNINGKRTQEPINSSFTKVFAQCWSATEESDTLLRAYSRVVKDQHVRRNILPRDEGVCVRTSPRKLLNALETEMQGGLVGRCYIGSMQYMSQDALFQKISDAVGQYGKNVFDQPNNLVKLALLKREAFSHESEVRLIFISDNSTPGTQSIRVKIEPNILFDEVTFDPRLETFERKEREALAKNLGYTGNIVESYLYQRPELVIRLPDRND